MSIHFFTRGAVCALLVAASPALAFRGGPPSGANGSVASFGNTCRACHGNTIGNGSVQILGAPATYTANTIYNLSVRVADATQLGAGFQISVEDAAGNHRGTMILVNATHTQHNAGWVNHTNAGVNNAVANWAANGNSATYAVQWQAPASDVGTLTFWAAGNAINNNFTNSGDIIYLTSTSATFSSGTGACCDDQSGICTEGQTQATCEGGGGRFGGAGSNCATIHPPCVTPSGACCNDGTGECIDNQTQSACQTGGGRYGGNNSTCVDINPPCVAPSSGACCDDRGVCTEGVLEGDCLDDGSRYGGDGSVCANFNPPCETPIAISLKPFVTGLASPVDLTHAGDGSGRVFIVDQNGRILIVDAGGNLLPTPFLDISSKLPSLNAFFDERGLLGLAFHPDYENNGRFFVRYSAPRVGTPEEPCNDPDGFIVGCHEEILAEYAVLGDPATSNVADPDSEIILYRADEPQFNHNAGQVAFGPDGFLYFTLGDGGGAHDGLADVPPSHGPIGNGQDRFSKLGKMHRIDVDSPPDPGLAYAIPSGNPFADGIDGLPEIFAYGLRNPFKFSFDDGPGGDGTLYLPDVGQNLYEEVNIGALGANYGWVIREGAHCFDPFNPVNPPASCPTTGALGEPLIDPVMEYLHRVVCTTDADCAALGVGCDEAAGQCENEGGISIIGGFIYRPATLPRGPDVTIPELIGKYVFGDFSGAFFAPGGRLYYMDTSGPQAFVRKQIYLAPGNSSFGQFLKGFGEDESGNLYVLASTQLGPLGSAGSVLRISPAFPTAPTPEPGGTDKSRFVSFSAPDPTLVQGSVETALRIRLTTLHSVVPPYTGGATIPFTAFEGQHVWVGPPATYFESAANPIPFRAAHTQCTPHYRDWSTEGVIHVTGSAIVPSSIYAIENVAAACSGIESSAECVSGGQFVSSTLILRTTRWADVETPFNPPTPSTQPDLADVGSLINKFRGQPGAPIKAKGFLAPVDAFGNIPPSSLSVDLGFAQISVAVDAFRGRPYPAEMGRCAHRKCNQFPAIPCTQNGDCPDGSCDPFEACTVDVDCAGASAPCVLYCP